MPVGRRVARPSGVDDQRPPPGPAQHEAALSPAAPPPTTMQSQVVSMHRASPSAAM